jgi:O-antigen ligase
MSSPMEAVLFAIGPGMAIILVLGAGVCLIRWAKKGGRGAAMLGSALVLLLGAGLVPEPPQQRIEEAREEKGKKGAESGDPPNP